MKSEQILGYVFAVIIIVLAIKLLWPSTESEHSVNTEITRDTVTVHDTTFVKKPVYVTKWKAEIDTVIVDNEKVLVAKADTTIQSDSSKIKVSYYFPPKNFFEIALDLKERIIHDLKTITEVKTVTMEQPFYKNIFVYTTLIASLLIFLVK
jgi:hypothetical protein